MTITKFSTWAILLVLLPLTWGCIKQESPHPTTLDQELENTLKNVSNGQGKAFFTLPDSDELAKIPQDPKNPLTVAKVKLGQMLFHETALAIKPKQEVGMNTYSCSSCHHAGAGFQAGVKQGIGEGGTGYGSNGEGRTKHTDYPDNMIDVQPLRSPSAMNSAYQQVMLWNGQFGATGLNAGTQANWTPGTPIATNHLGYEGVEIQAIAGLTVHRMEVNTAVLFPMGYKALFDEAFPNVPEAQRYTNETAGLAIAAFERTILASEAPFQKWLKGDLAAMSDAQKSGAILFFGKANCGSCHTGPALSSMSFHALGMSDFSGTGVFGLTPTQITDAGKGRGGFTKQPSDMYKFKVPQLYNLSNSPFYGHGGSFTSIKEVVAYKNKAVAQNLQVPQSQLASEFKALDLSETELDQVVAFLQKGLYDANLKRYEPARLLSGNCFPNADAQSKTDQGCN
ncbi:cytochrome c peroxidase [uncultured Microscilla sp.]|uniref:cytochrome-c peroxidase n=1 Tax=uncultured Microscilla sp. TaxID=432653 RepID=UPI002632F09F|nr:cytochrome c peroxidase [uncultured Microscilla sp.]